MASCEPPPSPPPSQDSDQVKLLANLDNTEDTGAASIPRSSPAAEDPFKTPTLMNSNDNEQIKVASIPEASAAARDALPADMLENLDNADTDYTTTHDENRKHTADIMLHMKQRLLDREHNRQHLSEVESEPEPVDQVFDENDDLFISAAERADIVREVYPSDAEDDADFVDDKPADSHEQHASKVKKCGHSKKDSKTKRQSKTKKRQKDSATLATINLDNLTRNDIFADAAQAEQLPDAPEPVKANRREGLAAMKEGVKEGVTAKDKSNDARRLERALQAFDGKRIHFADKGFQVGGVNTLLKPYQVIGVGFMRQQEKADGPNDAKGGILADTMGLGKTLMVLTNIVNARGKGNSARTLVVASPALLQQWKAEIDKHIVKAKKQEFGLTDHVVFWKDMQKTPDIVATLGKQDIVLATYHAVSKSYPKARLPEDCVTPQQKRDWRNHHFKTHAGPLHRIKWNRVVLDEAHAIKNHSSITSRACQALSANFYWAITGTPALNYLHEFYPYLKFIRDPMVNSFAEFEINFCDPDDEESPAKLRALLERVMLRRTHADQFLGARLVTLPAIKKTNIKSLMFSAFEREVYNIVRDRFIHRINEAVRRDDSVARRNRHIFTMLLRLRQLTGHIFLLQDTLSDILTWQDIKQIQKVCKTHNQKQANDDLFQAQLQLMSMLEKACKSADNKSSQKSQQLRQREAPFLDPLQMEESIYANLGGPHGTTALRPDDLLDRLVTPEALHRINERTKCEFCHHKPETPHFTDCNHIYCKKCIQDLQERAARFGRDHATCSACQHTFINVQPCEAFPVTIRTPDQDFIDSSEDDEDSARKRAKRKNAAKKDDWIKMEGPIPPSVKTLAMKAQIIKWLEEDPNIKIIVYSQFLPLLRLITKICKEESWTYVKYLGTMSAESRVKSIQKFNDSSKGIQLFLASLKCGGQGLNLTAAARVLIMDSWWNESIEQQAFCRVYRIGQERETQMCQLLVEDTIDEGMFMIKERKQSDINPILEKSSDQEGGTDKSFSTEQLLKLLGPVAYDDHGRPYIVKPRSDQDGDEEVRWTDLNEANTA